MLQVERSVPASSAARCKSPNSGPLLPAGAVKPYIGSLLYTYWSPSRAEQGLEVHPAEEFKLSYMNMGM